MKKLTYFNQSYNEWATKKLFENKIWTLKIIDWKIWCVLWWYFICIEDWYWYYIKNIIDWFDKEPKKEYELIYKEIEQNSKDEEVFIYETLTNSVVSNEIWYFYLLKCQDFYKIWITQDFKSRYKTYQTENPFETEIVFYTNCYWYSFVEKELKTYFEHKNHKWERFIFDENDVDIIKKCIYIANPQEWDEENEIYTYWNNTVFEFYRQKLKEERDLEEYLKDKALLDNKNIENGETKVCENNISNW